MNVSNQRFGVWVAGLIGFAGVLPVLAELPSLTDKETLGYFVAYQNKKWHFTVSAQGKAAIKPMNKKGEPLNQNLSVPVEFLVEEVMPDGKAVAKSLKPDTLESAQPATEKPQKIVFKGKVTGDASFEVFLNEERGVISLGGRLVDRGTLTKNPLRFSIRMKFSDAYTYNRPAGDKKKEEEFKDKIKGDRLQLMWTDGKRLKLDTDKVIDVGSKEINAAGIAALQVEFSSYDGKKFEFNASPNSVMALSGAQRARLDEGFLLTWTADPVKDPEAKARLTFEVK